MPVSFDLRDAPWIPVTDLDGTTQTVSLRDVLRRSHEFRDLAITIPPAASAVLRLLYTVTARVTKLDVSPPANDPEQWERRRAEIADDGALKAADVDAYLDLYPGRWDLFDKQRPWMQDARLNTEAVPVGLNRLDITRPNDNSPVWFRHTHHGNATPIPAHEAVLWLLVQHFYGAGGGGGKRTVGTQTFDEAGIEQVVSDQYMSSGPLRAVLTHYPLGRTLFDTVIAGIPREPKTAQLGIDQAPWERDFVPDPLAEPPSVTWPAGILLGRSRHAVLLHPDDTGEWVTNARVTWAFKKPHSPVQDPYCIQQRNNAGEWTDRRADAARASWRDLDALLADTDHHRRPDIVPSAISLPLEIVDSLRIRVHGIDQDRQASDKQWITSTTPPMFPWLAENDAAAAKGTEALRSAAEDVSDVLRSALRKAYRSLTIDGSRSGSSDVPWIDPAMARYWPRAEELFWNRLHERDFHEPYRAYKHIAVTIAYEITHHEAHQPSVARAVASAVRFLDNHAAKKEPRDSKESA